MGRRAALAAAVVGLLLTVAADARAEDPVAGDTRDAAIPLAIGLPATAATGGAHREPGDPEGGHSVWFRFDPPREGDYAVDFGGTTFDAVTAFAGTNPLGPFLLGGYDASHPSVQRSMIIHFYGPLAFRVDGVEPEDAGTARVTVRLGPAPEDDWARPVALDLAGTAVASASQIFAAAGLQPGEPGSPDDHQSVWFAFTAPRDGRLALDTCLPPGLSTSTGPVTLRALDDRPLGEAAVLAEGVTGDGRGRCVPMELDVRAGGRYRVQASRRYDGLSVGGTVALRGRMAGTPPAVTEIGLDACGSGACIPLAEVVAAPEAELATVECRVDGGAWTPCTRRADGTWAGPPFTAPPDEAGEHRFAVRATDAAGRKAKVLEHYNFAIPAAGVGPGPVPAPRGVIAPTQRPAARRALPLPRARFLVTRRGSRVRSLTASGLPAKATAALDCRGRGCPLTTRRRTARRAGTLALTPLLRGALLRPGAQLKVTVRAPGRATRSVTWTIRARRLPTRS